MGHSWRNDVSCLVSYVLQLSYYSVFSPSWSNHDHGQHAWIDSTAVLKLWKGYKPLSSAFILVFEEDNPVESPPCQEFQHPQASYTFIRSTIKLHFSTPSLPTVPHSTARQRLHGAVPVQQRMDNAQQHGDYAISQLSPLLLHSVDEAQCQNRVFSDGRRLDERAQRGWGCLQLLLRVSWLAASSELMSRNELNCTGLIWKVK